MNASVKVIGMYDMTRHDMRCSLCYNDIKEGQLCVDTSRTQAGCIDHYTCFINRLEHDKMSALRRASERTEKLPGLYPE